MLVKRQWRVSVSGEILPYQGFQPGSICWGKHVGQQKALAGTCAPQQQTNLSSIVHANTFHRRETECEVCIGCICYCTKFGRQHKQAKTIKATQNFSQLFAADEVCWQTLPKWKYLHELRYWGKTMAELFVTITCKSRLNARAGQQRSTTPKKKLTKPERQAVGSPKMISI